MTTTAMILRFVLAMLTLSSLPCVLRADSGTARRESRTVPAFTTVLLGTRARVIVRQGSPQRVVVEASPEDLGRLQTEVVDNQLRIHTVQKNVSIGNTQLWGGSVHLRGHVTVYVTLPVVRQLAVSSSGSLQADTVQAQHLRLAVSGSGKLRVGHVQATQVQARLSSSGHLAIAQLQADTLRAAVSGSGGITAEGVCPYSSLGLSSSGHLNTAGLAAKNCQVRLSGSGSCQVYVTQKLDAYISSSGTVLVSGNPQISKHISGSGRVKAQE